MDKRKKFIELLFLSGIFLSSIFFWPWAKIPFEIPKTQLINRWTEALALATLIFWPFNLSKERLDVKLLLLILSFFVIAVISGVLGVNFSKSFWGNYYRADGLYTLIHLILLLFFVAVVINKKQLGKTVLIFSLSAFFLSLLSLINWGALLLFSSNLPFISDWYGAIGVTFGNPNFLAGYLVVTLPFTYAMTKTVNFSESFPNSGKLHYLPKIGLFIQLSAILLTKAWSGFFGILLFLVGAAYIRGARKWVFLTVFTTLIISAFFYWTSLPSNRTPNIFIAESRQRIITKGILAFTKRPLLGWGWANFDYAFDSVVYPIKFQNDAYVDKAHSHFLEILVTTGITGLVVYLLIILRVLNNLRKIEFGLKKYIILAFVLFIVHSQTNVISISEEIIFWFIAGVATKIKL